MWQLDTLILASHESMDKKIPLTPKFKIGGILSKRYVCIYIYMGGSKKKGTPKWMVYNGKPY